jgi:TRAP-type C4-dicarboxylate transport system permease small subunit
VLEIIEQIRKRAENLAWIFFLCSVFAIFGLFTLIFADIVLRSTANLSIEGAVEIGEYILAAVGFLGLAYAQFKGGHIRVEVLLLRLPHKWQRIVDILILLPVIVFFVVMTHQIGMDAYTAWIENDSRAGTTLLIPTWPPKFAAFLGCTMLVIVFLIQLLGYVIDLIKEKNPVTGR